MAVIQSNETEIIFARSGMALSSRKLRIYGPKYLCSSSQVYKRGEPLKNNAAESSRKGVVGSIGRNIPITPSTKDMKPMAT